MESLPKKVTPTKSEEGIRDTSSENISNYADDVKRIIERAYKVTLNNFEYLRMRGFVQAILEDNKINNDRKDPVLDAYNLFMQDEYGLNMNDVEYKENEQGIPRPTEDFVKYFHIIRNRKLNE